MKGNAGNSDTLLLRFFYGTAFGRLFLKGLVQPGVSRAAGRLLSAGPSKWLVPYYIRKHNIDLQDIEIPEKGFASFNDFFTRKRKKSCCAASCDSAGGEAAFGSLYGAGRETVSGNLSGAGGEAAPGSLVSPCDAFLTCVKIRENTVFSIKNTCFSLEDLLKDRKLAAKFQRGTGLIFRLTPAHYHRYSYGAKGRVLCSRVIPGKLHCVRPVALRKVPVFVQNSREYQALAAEGFGTMVQMEIGALLVGKIRNEGGRLPGEEAKPGEEKGYFEFGGSTILILLPEHAVRFTEGFREKYFEYQSKGAEIPVRMGEVLGMAKSLV